MANNRACQQNIPNYPDAYIKAAVPIRIAMMCATSGNSPADYQGLFRAQEAAGLLTILEMDDELAIICWHDPRIARALDSPFARRVAS